MQDGGFTEHLRILPGRILRDDAGADALVRDLREAGGDILFAARVLF